MLKNIIRALRLPFVSASVIPFIAGSVISKTHFNWPGFIFGLSAVIFTHLSSNLMNDYSDSKAGTDWADKRFFGFFGGSKLIQEHVLSEKFYFSSSVFFGVLALISVFLLAKNMNSSFVIWIYTSIIFLGWSYSHGPLKFSYRMMGEFIIFILFGPATVMGGFFIQTGIFPDLKSFLISAIFGFFTTAILLANEIPDFQDDKKANKNTWVNFLGREKSYSLYFFIATLGFLSILLCFYFGFLGKISLVSLILILPLIRATKVLKEFSSDKERLIESSKLTIITQVCVGIILIIDLLL